MSVWMIGKVEAPPKENRIVSKATKERNISNWSYVVILIVKHQDSFILQSTTSAFLFLLRDVEVCQNVFCSLQITVEKGIFPKLKFRTHYAGAQI